ncbi:hypothetical protein D9599_00565 [Roseomonas sp. KE2513]|uniref:hypothetical protein n=1 Tax=Roseomonas sp. KE2513 TaxID=2479202 RepID=UPI0018DF26A5|nr:hypothetical protein [Roseomonas sp. KE2513]MBI0534069.1 hypothetical protein [Roseomonas sp. KE2513]
MTPAAILFLSAAEAAAALEEAAATPPPGGLLLLSAPAAAAWPGAAVVAAMLAQATARHPDIPFTAALDCGSAPGLALDALRQGWRLLVLDGAHPAFPAVAGAAAEAGATLLPAPPPALDLSALDLRKHGGRAILARHLRGTPPQP